jgi:hypothetical protein
MAKKTTPKKPISKKSFNLGDFKKGSGFDVTVKKKELSWIPLSDAFHDALKLPGIPRGYFTSFRGYSNTGKSTAVYEGVAGAQKIGDLPVIMETEGNWNWEHARNVGVQFTEVVDEETGEIIDYEGDFILMTGNDLLKRYGGVDYSNGTVKKDPIRSEPIIEDVARMMEELLDAQEAGDLPRNLVFFWDSVGSLNGFKSVMSKSNNNQWNAGSQEACFKALVNNRIPKSQNMDEEYTNTFVVVQKIWMDNENKKIKHKGGESFFYSPRIIVHFGGILSHATKKLKATSGGKEFQFGIETKVTCEKNQVNGVEQKGSIASTPHGYWNPDKIDSYKREKRDYILEQLNKDLEDHNIVKDFDIVAEDGTFSADDLSGSSRKVKK